MSSDKTWSTGEGNGNPFQYSCLENPIDSIKGKKYAGRKDPDAGKDWRQKEKGDGGGQRMRWLDSITHSMDMNLSKLWEKVEDKGNWSATVHEDVKSQTRLSDWTTTTTISQDVLYRIQLSI